MELWRVASALFSCPSSTSLTPLNVRRWTVTEPSSLQAVENARASSAQARTRERMAGRPEPYFMPLGRDGQDGPDWQDLNDGPERFRCFQPFPPIQPFLP